jgi:hypothetical protein
MYRKRGRLYRARVLRGGSWNNNRNNAHCANRNRNDPDIFNNNVGFRPVLSHVFLLSSSAGSQPGSWGIRSRAAAEENSWPVPGFGVR